MKRSKLIYMFATTLLLLFGTQSCYQDMDDSPAFDYPKGGEGLVGDFGESFYMPFEDDYIDKIYSDKADVVGKPTFAEGKKGKAYKGATDSYITFSGNTLLFQEDFTAALWYKLVATPDRAGILVLSPAPPKVTENVMTSGFRLFREASGTNQIVKLNVGDGTKNYWLDGGVNAKVAEGEWAFIAFTISKTKCILYVNGEVVAKNETFPGISWEGANLMSLGSGVPRFQGWNHKSDLSSIDELRIFNKELTQDEIKNLMK